MDANRSLIDQIILATCQLRWETAAMKFQFNLQAMHRAMLELRYSPDQPRLPAGISDGGRWTDEGGSSGDTTRIAQGDRL